MGVRSRLIAIITLVLGMSVALSMLLVLRVEDWEERRSVTEAVTATLGALAVPIAEDLAASPDAVRRLVTAIEREAETFQIRQLRVLDRHGFDLGHDVMPNQDPFLFAVVAGDNSALADPPPPAWPRRVAHPIVVGAERYVLVADVDERFVNTRLVERTKRLLTTAVVVSLLGLLVLLLALAVDVLQPISALARMAETLGRGERIAPQTVGGGRELRQLATALQNASHALGQRREELEAEVAHRTAELHAANEELRVMNERLQQLALTDPLTGLFNRRALEQALALEVTRQKRGRRPFSLMMLDVDHFKMFNDKHGHQAGDEALRGIARAVSGSLRASDVVARVGGEEFVVLLLDTELPHARTVAEKVRDAVRSAPIPFAEHQPLGRMTVSIGVACWPKHGDHADDVLAAADRALYAAKAAGRDRVMTAPEEASAAVDDGPQQPV